MDYAIERTINVPDRMVFIYRLKILIFMRRLMLAISSAVDKSELRSHKYFEPKFTADLRVARARFTSKALAVVPAALKRTV